MVFAQTNEEIHFAMYGTETFFVERNSLDLSGDKEEEPDSNNKNDESLGVEATTSNDRVQKKPAVKKAVGSFHMKRTQVQSNK